MSEQIADSQVIEDSEIYDPQQLAVEFEMIRSPYAVMLKPGGDVQPIKARLRWQLKTEDTKTIRVRYNRGYVVRTMAYNCRFLIKDMSLTEWENLMHEVYREGHISQED